MKTHRLFIVSSIALALILALALTACSKPQGHLEQFHDFPGLLSAMQAFSQDLTHRGQPLPQSVSLDELVSRGYISSNSVHAVQGMETKVWLAANPAVLNSTNPAALSSVLMSARLPDGSVSAALADGSVQQFSVQSFAAHLQKTGQQGGPANRSQPIRVQTNGTSAAAGSAR